MREWRGVVEGRDRREGCPGMKRREKGYCRGYKERAIVGRGEGDTVWGRREGEVRG